MYWARGSPMVMVQCTGEAGAEEGVGAGSSTTMFSIGTSLCSGYLPASQSAAMAAISLWSIIRPSRRALEREEAMVGSSGVDRRIGTDEDDCSYGRRSSLYSMEGRTCGAGVAASGNRVSLMWVADGRTDDTCVI